MVDEEIELSVVMPCLNEVRTLRQCISKALDCLNRLGISGEVIIADNGSTDGSQQLAASLGARVVDVAERGYGAALRAGIAASRGTYVVMGDSDDSYDFSRLDAFVERLRAGDDLVMGNRFQGGIAPGAMPLHHRLLGNPVLSFVGRLFFGSPIGDFHCGLRAFNRVSILGLRLNSSGMEFASEMIVKATLMGLRVSEVPTTLSKDGRDRPPHLRSFRDGWRHLRFLLLHCPQWLFLVPAMACLTIGSLLQAALYLGPLTFGKAVLDIQTMLYAAALSILGMQILVFWIFANLVAWRAGLLPTLPRAVRFVARQELELWLSLGVVLFVIGFGWAALQAFQWAGAGFGQLDPAVGFRASVPAMTLMVLGAEVAFASFLVALQKVGCSAAAFERPQQRYSSALGVGSVGQ